MAKKPNNSIISTKINDLISQQRRSYFGSSLRDNVVKFRATSGGDCCVTTTPLKRDLEAFISVDIFGPRQRLLIS